MSLACGGGESLLVPGPWCCRWCFGQTSSTWLCAAAWPAPKLLGPLEWVLKDLRCLSCHADPCLLSPPQMEQQGLDASASVAAVEGVPVAAVERWDEQSGTQRLLENLAAYRAFRVLLAQMLEEQRELLGEADAALGRALAAVLLQVSAFTYHLEELLQLESRRPPGEEGAGPAPPSHLGLFERKLRGLGVLRELAQWAVRSARDLRQLARPSPGSSSAPSPAESP